MAGVLNGVPSKWFERLRLAQVNYASPERLPVPVPVVWVAIALVILSQHAPPGLLGWRVCAEVSGGDGVL